MLREELGIGTRVVVVMPPRERRDDYPQWAPDMDEFDGCEMHVIGVDEDYTGRVSVRLAKPGSTRTCGWSFAPAWLDPFDPNHTGDAMERLL